MIKITLLLASQIPPALLLIMNWEENEIFRSFGFAFGYSALSCFIIAALLSLRFSAIERLFHGLDNIYEIHHLMGRLTVGFVILHILFIFSSYSRESVSYFLNPAILSFDYLSGWISLLLILIVIFFAVFLDRGHKLWRTIHLLSFPAYLSASYHFYSLSSTESIVKLGYIFALFLGLASMLLSTFKYFSRRYKIEKIDHLNESVVSLSFKPLGRKINYKPSQFVFVSFESYKRYSACCEFHPFTITSVEGDEFLEVVVKSRGDCSSKIQGIERGAIARLDGAYGGFVIKDASQVWIGAGIGITPFVSLVRQVNCKVDLYYVVKNDKDFVLLDRLRTTANKGVTIYPVLIDNDSQKLLSIIKANSSDLPTKYFLISGPPSMVNDLHKLLQNDGVPSYNIEHETCGFMGYNFT